MEISYASAWLQSHMLNASCCLHFAPFVPACKSTMVSHPPPPPLPPFKLTALPPCKSQVYVRQLCISICSQASKYIWSSCMICRVCDAATHRTIGRVCQASHVCDAVSESLDHGEEGRQAADRTHQRLVLGGQEHARLHCHTAPERFVFRAGS